MEDLFSEIDNSKIQKTFPLAARMRPKKVSDILGQDKVLYPGSPLRRLIDSKSDENANSVILWGPPGSGKTTIANLIANDKNIHFSQLSAVTSGVNDIREVVENARSRLLTSSRKTILFVDEVHRFSKSQQDALLPSVENSIITLIAATTENPSFSIITPLISRSLVIRLEAISEKDVKKVINRAIRSKDGLDSKVSIDKKALDNLVRLSAGDARRALNFLEAAASNVKNSNSNTAKNNVIDNKLLEKIVDENIISYDAAGDEHYDVASAFIKSLRGSDVDAALHYLARMISGGEDPRFIARRLIIAAAEEVGMADPNALSIAVAAAQSVQLIGLPEARIPLAQAVIYIATAPKSNSAYLAIDKALEDIQTKNIGKVPPHLRDTHYKGAKSYGHGSGYIYAHDKPYDIAAQQYLPDALLGSIYYNPKSNGEEKVIQKRIKNIRDILNSK
ncbi:MAG: replication-associated recombination protein A [Bifidobacteriaceae bacterium]|nr:replication-associated recombination protein A [Bifidobacteriaceae bacterium]